MLLLRGAQQQDPASTRIGSTRIDHVGDQGLRQQALRVVAAQIQHRRKRQPSPSVLSCTKDRPRAPLRQAQDRLAREGHQLVFGAAVSAHSRETVRDNPAFDVSLQLALDVRRHRTRLAGIGKP